MRARKDSGNLQNGKSGGKRRSRRLKQSNNEKGGRTVKTAAPALSFFKISFQNTGRISTVVL